MEKVKDKLIEIREHLRKKGVDYADMRYESSTSQGVSVRNDEVEKVSEGRSSGVGVRVIYNGSWGFAAASSTSEEDLIRTADTALDVAKASAMLGKKKHSGSFVQEKYDREKSMYAADRIISVSANIKQELVELYHQRWEIELGFDELKTHMLERKECLRSKKPDGVHQELWGQLLTYNLVRREMLLAAQAHNLPPKAVG